MDSSILGQVAFGYSPVIDRNRAVTATRVTVFPLKPEGQVDINLLLTTLGSIWPEKAGQVLLNVAGENLLKDLFGSTPPVNFMVEVPAFMACDAANTDAIRDLHMLGNQLLVRGRPAHQLPRELLTSFKYAIIDLDDDRRIGQLGNDTAYGRVMPFLQSGVHTLAEMEESFGRNALGVIGWPMEDTITESAKHGKSTTQPDLQVIIELISRVEEQEPIEKLEATLRRDPTLAFKLMRYINSAAFGLTVEIASFRHAIMMLGYQRLKRWLALLLATAGKDANLKPVMFAAVRRGMLMEELVRSSGDEEMRNEMFICGVFSLLDRMFRQPFSDLLKTIPVPERVYQALVENTGSYQPYFDLVRAVENESLYEIRESAERLMLSMEEINQAIVRALSNAAQLD
jgi:EAL and modified HD-GYP domain-containing signal transduction protein